MMDQLHPAPQQSRSACLGMMIGGGLGLVVLLLVVTYWARRDKLPDVDRQVHRSMFTAWKKVAPPNYDIETKVTGRQPAIYSVKVRQGKVTTATRNGTPLQQQRTMGTWSVPGMFDTMESDLMNQSDAREERLMSNSPRVTVRAAFHPKWHFPEKYQRIEWGSQYEVEWQVMKFIIIDEPIKGSLSGADQTDGTIPSSNR